MSELERFVGQRVDATTCLAGVIGNPVAHSLSPAIHNAAYQEMGLNWIYGAFKVLSIDVPAAIFGARSLGFQGLSVTMPHKEAAAGTCEQLTQRAELLGSVNTISFRAGVVVGDSTDGDGLIDDLRSELGFELEGKTCAVLGVGGAGRAVVVALALAGVKEILVVNRSLARAELAAALAPNTARVATPDEVGTAALVVNATPIGMEGAATTALAPRQDAASFDLDSIAETIGPSQLVVDLIYAPATTVFLAKAAERGAQTRNGLGMLVAQAALQIEQWTGLKAPRAAMLAAALQATRS